MKTKGNVCRRVLATFILAAMLVTSSAVTAYAAPEGATVIDLTVAGGGGGQDSSACVLHSSYDDEGHFLICDTHTGTGTWNGRAHENGRVDYKKHDIKYFGAEPNCNVLKPVGYWYCADGCGYRKSGRLEHTSNGKWLESGNSRHYMYCTTCNQCWTDAGFHVVDGKSVDQMEDHTQYGKATCEICGLDIDLSHHTVEPAWDTGVSSCSICGDHRPFLNTMWLEKSTMDLVSKDSDYIEFRIYGSADRMSLMTGTTGFGWVYYPSDVSDTFDIGVPQQIGSGVDASGNTYRDYRITLSYKNSTVATAGISQATFALYYTFGSSTANATAAGKAEAAKWTPSVGWGVTPTLFLLRTFTMSGGVCTPVGTSVVTYDKQVGGYAQNVTIKSTWYSKRAGSAEVALFDQNGTQVTDWTAAAPSGGAWEYTSVISPNVNLSTAQTYTVRCKNYLGGYGSVDCVIQPTDMTGPILKSTSDLTVDWAKNKAYAARALDEGVGNVEISFDGDTDYRLGTDIGEKNYSRNYVFTGDVYTEQTHTFYMRDALGNVGTGALKVNRLDNTPPTVTNVISALDGTGHRAKLTATYHDEHATLGEGSGVAELAVSKVNDASSLTWKHKDDAMFVTQAGTYFVFAKDAAGNVSTGYPVDVTINDYVVKATFVSGTDGRELPDEVWNALPSDQTGLSIGETVNPPMSVGTTVVEHRKSMELGEWTLAGWDKDSVTVTGDGQYFVGTWTFKPYTAMVSYAYVSGTEDRVLPASLQPPADCTYCVGEDVTPRVPETVHDEKYESLTLGTWTLTGWDKYFAIVPNEGVTFTATWEFVPATSTVRYRYESVTEGRDLPTELKAASDAIYNVGSDVKAPDVLGNTYEEKNDAGLKLGTWTMTGWDKDSAIVPNEEVIFVGQWIFRPEVATVNYKFNSGTSDRELPLELQELMTSVEKNVGDDAGILGTIPTTFDEYKNGLKIGTWTLTGWDQNAAIVTNSGAQFNATWEYKQDDYSVTYVFVDKNEKELPEDILKLLPAAVKGLENGSTVKTPELETKSVGRWTFDGWDITEAAIADKDVVVTGTWHYTPRRHYTEPTQPTSKDESPTTADTGIALYTISSISSVVALGGVSFLNRKRKGKND